jgi:hypothetical protein
MMWENDTKRGPACQGDSISTCRDKRGFDSCPDDSSAAFMMVEHRIFEYKQRMFYVKVIK